MYPPAVVIQPIPPEPWPGEQIKCKRTVCPETVLTHRHVHTGFLYCADCARRINAACQMEYCIPRVPLAPADPPDPLPIITSWP